MKHIAEKKFAILPLGKYVYVFTHREGLGFFVELLNSSGILKHLLSFFNSQSFHSVSDFCGLNNAFTLVSSKYDKLF